MAFPESTSRVSSWSTLKSTFVVLIALLVCSTFAALDYDKTELGSMSWCGSRPDACCDGRRDKCSVPFMGSVCYCDAFCNRTHSPGYQDCCPDYFRVCLGEPEPLTRMCSIHGQFINEGDYFNLNCKQCKCIWNGMTMYLDCDEKQQTDCLVNTTMIDIINRDRRRFGWHARNYTEFWGKDMNLGFDRRLGTLLSTRKVLNMLPIKPDYDKRRLPRSFDSRQKWRGMIEQPRDQGWCNASWAVSTASVASDRTSILLKRRKTLLSPQHLLSCNAKTQDGCQGGHLSRAWVFIRRFGLVGDGCFPWEGKQTSCVIAKRKAANESRCVPRNMRSPLYRVSPVYRIAGEDDIMYEISKSGPVQATMRVYQDFFVYGGGIYRCTDLARSQRTGLHSVRILGWGEEVQAGQTVKYWIASNSWGQWWGENGYFRIRKGFNDCNIENFVLSAWAAHEKTPTINYRNPNKYDNTLSNDL
ncbi:hypothetical protein LSTR_LSTR006623 [Laodelphax striatellus]|uniref:SMB domain-containing protein n=1 Tax=Laodelphax striatellus TaxID=195883 RepID=A0A482X966_LAOST|nr:hypothetical protein LSTR_LSTR006623 [Laodelphax striatellus]